MIRIVRVASVLTVCTAAAFGQTPIVSAPTSHTFTIMRSAAGAATCPTCQDCPADSWTAHRAAEAAQCAGAGQVLALGRLATVARDGQIQDLTTVAPLARLIDATTPSATALRILRADPSCEPGTCPAPSAAEQTATVYLSRASTDGSTSEPRIATIAMSDGGAWVAVPPSGTDVTTFAFTPEPPAAGAPCPHIQLFVDGKCVWSSDAPGAQRMPAAVHGMLQGLASPQAPTRPLRVAPPAPAVPFVIQGPGAPGTRAVPAHPAPKAGTADSDQKALRRQLRELNQQIDRMEKRLKEMEQKKSATPRQALRIG